MLAYLLKIPCTEHTWDGYQYRRSCYNDIFALYFFRGLSDGRFPYFDADLEYPVVTGLFMGATSELVHDGRSFFQANAVGLAAFGFAGAVGLAAMASRTRRLALWALAPSMILYAFHNWDLIAVGLSVMAMYAFSRGADRTAGALSGLGAAAKLFPGLLVIAFVLKRRKDQGRIPWRIGAWAAGVFAAVNLPILIASPRGWWYQWQFHSTRFPNFENVWYFIYRHTAGMASASFWQDVYPRLTSVASALLFVAASAMLARAEYRRERVRPYVLAFGVLCLFLLTSKVFSPQYALWLLPFFVLLDIPAIGIGAFFVADAAVWFGISAYFLAVQHSGADPELRLSITEIAVFVRYAVIAWLVARSRGSAELVGETQT